jgi:ribosomal protein S18 acetylase RimI-like enzyme
MFPQTFALAVGERLTIRPPAPHELPALFAFVAETHDSPALGAWARDALSGRHPEMTPDSALVAVAGDGLIPQLWQYASAALPVMQLEAIGVAPAYRGRGLARAMLAAAEGLAQQQGQLLLAIVGPPNLYRRFGYSYALRFRGGRALAADTVPPTGSATARQATLHDIPALQALDAAANGRLLLRRAISAARWAYDLAGHSPDSDAALQIDLVLDQSGAPLAYARSFPAPWDGELGVVELALGAGDPAEVARALVAAWRARHGHTLAQIAWELDEAHPLFAALDTQLSPPRRP